MGKIAKENWKPYKKIVKQCKEEMQSVRSKTANEPIRPLAGVIDHLSSLNEEIKKGRHQPELVEVVVLLSTVADMFKAISKTENTPLANKHREYMKVVISLMIKDFNNMPVPVLVKLEDMLG